MTEPQTERPSAIAISPPPVTQWNPTWLPAYLSNGVMGLRIPRLPTMRGSATLSGYIGRHPEAQIPSAAPTPYPLLVGIALQGAAAQDAPDALTFEEQRYDFTCGELTTRYRYSVHGVTARITVLAFCSRDLPSIALQEISCEVDADCMLALETGIDPAGVPGTWAERSLTTPTSEQPVVDGSMLWQSLGEQSTCGAAYITQCPPLGDEVTRHTEPREQQPLRTTYTIQAHPGRIYRVRHFASLVPSAVHSRPREQAVRAVAEAARRGFDDLREANQACWRDLWRGRIELCGADTRWQALADAAFYYLHASTHRASPSSTSLFGLAQWPNHHYYYGHVMWDLEMFCTPVLSLTAPDAAAELLRFRFDRLPAARGNARLWGEVGAQFPWEASMLMGEESAPAAGEAAAYEHHVSLDIALAFLRHASVAGDERFLNDQAWPVLQEIADWLTRRVEQSPRGFEIKRVNGVAERKSPADNNAYMNMAASVVLRAAAEQARARHLSIADTWQHISTHLVLPMQPDGLLVSHDGFDPNEEAAATPEPLAGIFPAGYELAPEVRDRCIEYYLDRAHEYIGSPMLSAIYPVWASQLGDRARTLELLERGYGDFNQEPYGEPDEWSDAMKPDYPRVGPFFANLGGFLLTCLYGFTGLRPSFASPDAWPQGNVTLPAGWQSIEVDRLFLRGRPHRLVAAQGAPARFEPIG